MLWHQLSLQALRTCLALLRADILLWPDSPCCTVCQAKQAEQQQALQSLEETRQALKQEAAALATDKAAWQARMQDLAWGQAPSLWIVPDHCALHLSPSDTFKVDFIASADGQAFLSGACTL